MRFKRIEGKSYYTYLSEGCKLCRRGAKLVLFLTGVCRNNCYYCPVSLEKIQKDVVYANERRVERIDDIIDEIMLMSAEGVAITGGEPLMRIERLKEFLEVFSHADLHTHLYTSLPIDETVLKELVNAGLNEIRFHPVELRDIERYEEAVKNAIKAGIEVGIEIPAIRYDNSIVKFVEEHDIFLNVNELEFSASNYSKLIEKGWKAGEFYEAVESEKIARMYAEKVEKFHYCSVRFKEIAQFRRRLIRMAFNHPEFYKVTSEGTIVCGLVEGEKDKMRKLLIQWGIDFVEVDEGFEIPVEEAEKLKDRFEVWVIERYPTSNRVILEKQKLR